MSLFQTTEFNFKIIKYRRRYQPHNSWKTSTSSQNVPKELWSHRMHRGNSAIGKVRTKPAPRLCTKSRLLNTDLISKHRVGSWTCPRDRGQPYGEMDTLCNHTRSTPRVCTTDTPTTRWTIDWSFVTFRCTPPTDAVGVISSKVTLPIPGSPRFVPIPPSPAKAQVSIRNFM